MGDPDPQNRDDNDIDMGNPCEICGDIGFINAIRECSLCGITREHEYCMKVMHETEADKWICEDCEYAKVPLSSPVPNKQPEHGRPSFMSKKPPQITKVKYITPEEVRALESRAVEDDSIFQSRSHLSPGSLMDKAPVPLTGLSVLFSNSSAKPGPQIRVSGSGFKKSLDVIPHLEKNIPTVQRCTFRDPAKHNSEKYGIPPVHISFQLVQCLPAIDLATLNKLKFCGPRPTFSRQRKKKRHFQSPEESAPCKAKASMKKPVDISSISRGETEVQQTFKSVMMNRLPSTKPQRTQDPTSLVSKNFCPEQSMDSLEANSNETSAHSMHRKKRKVGKVNLKVPPMPSEDEFEEDDFDKTPLAHHKCKRKVKVDKVSLGSKSSQREEESKDDDSDETPLIYRMRKRKRKVNVVYLESESSPSEGEDNLQENYSKEPKKGLFFAGPEDGYAVVHDLISSIVCEEDRQLLDSMEDRVFLEALYQSVKTAVTTVVSAVRSVKMSYSLKEGHAKLKDLEEDRLKLKALWERVQRGHALLTEGRKEQLVLINHFSKQLEEKLAQCEDHLLRTVSFVNQEFRKAINEGKLKQQANEDIQLMQWNQEALVAYQWGKEIAHRHLQSTISEMFPNLDWSLVEAKYQALVDAEEAKVVGKGRA